MSESEELSPALLAEIEAYYDGTLSPDAVRHLRSRLQQDEELATAVADWEAVYRYGLRPDPAESAGRDVLRTRFRELEATLPAVAPTPMRTLRPYHWLAVAATVLLLLLGGWWVLQRPTPAQRLAEDNFVFLKREDLMLGKEDQQEDAALLYDRGEYAAAWPQLADEVAKGQRDSIYLLYAGVAALGAHAPDRARTFLTDLLAAPGQYSEFDAGNIHYYLALAELELGKVTAAREQLRLVTGGPEKEEAAAHMLEELDKLDD